MTEYKIEKKKILFNAIFKPSVEFFLKQYELLKMYKKYFPSWEVSGLNFTVQDRENHCSSTITHSNIIFEIDDANSKVEFLKKTINNILSGYNEFFPIESFIRLGLRFYIFIPMLEIKKEELADIIQSKLFVSNNELTTILSEKVTDLAYIRDYKKDEFLYHFKCGPMPKEQIPAWVDFGQNKHRFNTPKDFKEYLDSFPDMSIYIDIDCYKQDIPFSDMGSFLTKSIDNCIKTATSIKKYILGE